jgi:hypothetical protein
MSGPGAAQMIVTVGEAEPRRIDRCTQNSSSGTSSTSCCSSCSSVSRMLRKGVPEKSASTMTKSLHRRSYGAGRNHRAPFTRGVRSDSRDHNPF